MQHSIPLITTIALGFALALLFGVLAARLKMPALVGYLLAGVAIGPFTPGLMGNVKIAQELAEIGVMLLMFGVGLHFSVPDLMRVRKIAIPGAIFQIVVATILGGAIAILWGWNYGGALIFGLSLSVASTVVLLRSLEERAILDTINGHIAVGWLLVEDLAMVIALVLLPPLAHWLGSSSLIDPHQPLWLVIGLTFVKISSFIALMLFVGRRFFPKLLWYVAKIGSRELFTLCIIATAISVAYLASKLFGVSFALGAFFAGMIMRESSLSHRAAEESLPLREAFAVLFFVAVGMLFDPKVLLEQPLQVLTVVGIVVIGKSIAAFVLVLVFRYPLLSALIISASLAQIGEFSFILAELGIRLGILPEKGQSLILAGALISIAINPLIFKSIEPIHTWIKSCPRLFNFFQRKGDPLADLPMTKEELLSAHVVLVGYGRVGMRVAHMLSEIAIPFVVIEENREIIESLRSSNILAVYGDASELSVLVQSHIARASMLIIAMADTVDLRNMIRNAYELNAALEVIVRTHDEEEATLLQKEITKGKIFFAEGEIAKSMGEYALNRYRK